MKEQGIAPSEVMYTSLMTRAERLVELESSSSSYYPAKELSRLSSGDTKAIEVYTELMKSLMDVSFRSRPSGGKPPKQHAEDPNTLLLKVFLVFQEMKAAGAQPDLACYNALLRACARAGDVARAQAVLSQIQEAELDPNDTSWRQLIQVAAKVRQSDLALSFWKQGLSYRSKRVKVDEPLLQWRPSIESFSTLISAHLQEAVNSDPDTKIRLYEQVLGLYEGVLLGRKELGVNRIDPNSLLDNQRAMLTILQAIVSLDELLILSDRHKELGGMAKSILALECLQNVQMHQLGWNAAQVYQRARSWQNKGTLAP
jgi:pentatricopeptide repeat protein